MSLTHVMHFQSPTPGILISDLKNCINDHASYCSKGNSRPSSFSIPPQRPTKQTCCDAAVDERPGHCRLQRAGSESQCLISMFFASIYITTFSSSTQDEGCTRHSKHQKCNNEHKKRLCRPFSPTSNVYQGTGSTLSKITKLPTVHYSQRMDSSLGRVKLFMLKYFIYQECMNDYLAI